mgnify:CR=1 FL=1
MPLSWVLAAVTGIRLAPPKDRPVAIRKVAANTNAHVGRGPDSEST